MIPPTPPMKLITPLALLRSGEGVRSGMRAITGVRRTAMPSSITPAPIRNRAKAPPLAPTSPLCSGSIMPVAIGIRMKAAAATGAALRMYG